MYASSATAFAVSAVSGSAAPAAKALRQTTAVAVAHLRTSHAGSEAFVVRHELLVDDLPRPPAEVIGRPSAPPLALPVVDEAEPWHEERERRGGLMNLRGEDGGRARLVVIFEKTNGPALVVEIGEEMAAHRGPVLVAQAVVETFVVGVVEPLLLEGPLEVPVRFGHEDEVRPALAHARDGRRPEGTIDGRAARAACGIARAPLIRQTRGSRCIPGWRMVSRTRRRG